MSVLAGAFREKMKATKKERDEMDEYGRNYR